MRNTVFLIFFSLFFSVNCGFCSALTDDYVDIASSLVQDGKYSQALNYINKAIEIDSTDKNLLDKRNSLYRLMGRNDLADSAKISSVTDNDLIYAVENYNAGRFKEAKENLDRYLMKMPKSDFAYMLRAKTNMNLDETPSALRDIKSAQTISNNPEYQLVEALILYNTGKYAQSRDILNKLSDDIQIYNIYKYLGLNNFKLGDYKKAVESFDKAILLYDEDKTLQQTYNEAKRMSYGK